MSARPRNSELLDLAVVPGKCLPRRVQICLDALANLFEADSEQSLQHYVHETFDAPVCSLH